MRDDLSLAGITPPTDGTDPTYSGCPLAARPTSDLSRERADAEPTKFLPIVCSWLVTSEQGRKVVLVDGRAWKRHRPAEGHSTHVDMGRDAAGLPPLRQAMCALR
jgi:hypothetical protein